MSTGRTAHWGIRRRQNMLPDWAEILIILTFRLDYILGNPQDQNLLTIMLNVEVVKDPSK